MPKYSVKIEEIAVYTIDIEAETEAAAREAAEEKFVAADDIRRFPCEVTEREVADVQLLS